MSMIYTATDPQIIAIESAAQSVLDTCKAIRAANPTTPPISPTQILLPFNAGFTKSFLQPQDATKVGFTQRYVDTAGVYEACVWENLQPVVFTPDPATGRLKVRVDNQGAGFDYVNLYSDKGGMAFGDKVLHIHQEVQYHLTDRRINVFYFVPNDENDMRITRILSEWINPFFNNGIVIFMLRQYWQVRAYNDSGHLFANNPDSNLFNGGFANSPFRASPRMLPTTPAITQADGSIIRYESFDNGAISEHGLLHPVDFYISQSRIRVVENGFLKVDLPCNLNFSQGKILTGVGTYHVDNELGPGRDFANQEAAGNGREQGFLDLGLMDERTFGPLTLEILSAMP